MESAARSFLGLALLLGSCTNFDDLSRSYEGDLALGAADLSAVTDGISLHDAASFADMQPVCDDGLVGAGETDVDCGGGCAPCDVSRVCVTDVDCQTGFCDGGRCELVTGPPGWVPVGMLATNGNPPIARYDHAMTRGPDGELFVMGGRDSMGNALNTGERLDESLNWNNTSNLQRQRSRFALVTTTDSIVAIDGVKGNGFENTAERAQDPPGNFTLLNNALGQNVSDHGAVAVGDKVFVYGGNDGAASLATMYTFTIGNNTLAGLKAMGTPREHFGAALGPDGRIYAMGGINVSTSLNTAEAYDVVNDKWVNIAPLPEPRATAPAVAAPDGRIYVVGGADAQAGKMYKTAVAYRLAKGTQIERWATVAPMAGPRWRHAAAVGIDGRIYVVGGADLVSLPRLVEAYGPIITVTPGTINAGGTVTVSGSNFAKNTTVHFSLDSADGASIGSGNTDGTGTLPATSVTIPAKADAKVTRLYAMDPRSRYPVSAKLTITP